MTSIAPCVALSGGNNGKAAARDYRAAIGEIIIKYNGTLERYAGESVMVVFNDPVPVERSCDQASKGFPHLKALRTTFYCC